jgi:nicotinamidase-related amidase
VLPLGRDRHPGGRFAVKRALLLVDVVQTFEHDDGDRLLASFRERHDGFLRALAEARGEDVPIVYANDDFGSWQGDASELVRKAVEEGRGGELVRAIAPEDGDRFLLKPRYSAFKHTPLDLLLRELGVELILLAGAATEMCVVQTAIDARDLDYKVTVLADACACNDERLERLALEYLDEVVGARVERFTTAG